MENLTIKTLIPNNNHTKYFGVDYFANIYDGSNPSFRYFSSSIDPIMNYKEESISFNEIKYSYFTQELRNIEPNKIIGFFQNPCLYSNLKSIDFILDELDRLKLGLFLETNSENILNDIERLIAFGKKRPLLIALPIYSFQEIEMSFFSNMKSYTRIQKIINCLKSADINFGVVVKPIIPKINDLLSNFERIIKSATVDGQDFIYPSFTLYFDSFKIHNFYDIINIEKSELMNYFFDNFGQKYNWESENIQELKKIFVFSTKKNKINYAMKDIINLYRESDYTQLKLF